MKVKENVGAEPDWRLGEIKTSSGQREDGG